VNFIIEQVYFVSDCVQWSEILKYFEYTDIYHAFEYVNLESARIGGSPSIAIIQMSTGFIGIPLIFRKIPNESRYIDAVSVYGYNGVLTSASIETADFISGVDKIKTALAQRNCVSFFNRESNFSSYRLPDSIQAGKVLGVDLTQTPEAYEQSLPRRIRQQVRALRKLNYTVTQSSAPENILEFCEVYKETMLRRNAAAHYFFSYDYFNTLLNINQKNLSLKTVYHEGKMICGAIFATEGDHLYYMFSGSLIDVTPYPAIRLVFDEVILENLNKGKKILHLGGGFGGAEDSLYQFKNFFGKIVLPFYVTRWILLPEIYHSLSANANSADTFFPKYRSP